MSQAVAKASDHPAGKSTGKWTILLLVGLFILALAIRLYDITDLPFDFHPTRQLYTAVVARGLYYESQPDDPGKKRVLALDALRREEREPPSIDGLAALSYKLIGREVLWLPRAMSAIFWVLGGIAVFLLSRQLTSEPGGVAATAVYLFLPYGVIASRSFQPDPLMTALIVFSWWGMYNWMNRAGWRWVFIAGIPAGLAIYFKSLAAFSILGAYLGILMVMGFSKLLRSKQFWLMVVLTVLPTIGYMIDGFFVTKGLSNLFGLRFFPSLWLQPYFYLQWLGKVQAVATLGFLVLGLIGIFFFKQREDRRFVIGLWLGYIIFGFVFAYYFGTHDYYHLSLVPIVAISIASVAEALWQRLQEVQSGRFARIAVGLLLTLGLAVNLWNIRTIFHKVDYRPQQADWEKISEVVGSDTSIIALTQDYGYRLEIFSWINPAGYWPYRGDTRLRELAGIPQPEFATRFADQTRGMEFFVVTDLEEFAAQTELKEFLTANYPVFAEGPTYIIFDLRKGS
jgi:hypothetical protein